MNPASRPRRSERILRLAKKKSGLPSPVSFFGGLGFFVALSRYPIRHEIFTYLTAYEVSKFLCALSSAKISLSRLTMTESEIELMLNPLRDIFYQFELETIDKLIAMGFGFTIFGGSLTYMFDRLKFAIPKMVTFKPIIKLSMIVTYPSGSQAVEFQGWCREDDYSDPLREKKIDCPDPTIIIRAYHHKLYSSNSMRYTFLPGSEHYINVNVSPFVLSNTRPSLYSGPNRTDRQHQFEISHFHIFDHLLGLPGQLYPRLISTPDTGLPVGQCCQHEACRRAIKEEMRTPTFNNRGYSLQCGCCRRLHGPPKPIDFEALKQFFRDPTAAMDALRSLEPMESIET